MTLKKDPCCTRAGSPGHKTPSRALASLSAAHRSQALGFHRRDWTKTNMARLPGWAPKGYRLVRQGSGGPQEDRNVPRRPAQRSYRCSLPIRRTHQRRMFPRLVEKFLVPTLKPNDVVFDNLGSHKGRQYGRRSATSGRTSYSSRNAPPISIRSSRSSRSSKPCY